MDFSELTTLKIGGPVNEIIPVRTEEELISNLKSLIFNHESYLVIGGGSNLLVSDNGFDGLILKNEIVGIERNDNNLIVKSGTILQDLVDYANNVGLSGFENLAGIPGTVGGALYGNAGAYGQTISDHLVSLKTFIIGTVIPAQAGIQLSNQNLWILGTQIRDDKQTISLTKTDCQFSYRDSIFKQSKNIILEATFSLAPANPGILKKISAETIKKREVKYPPGIKCPGSFFKNIPQDMLSEKILDKLPKEFILFSKVSAGALLESVGAKGATKGNIRIAPYHANLFINEGEGTAKDFYELAKTYRQKVSDEYGIELEPEVQLINLPPLT